MDNDFSNFKERDPFILLSIINTHLRDYNPDLTDFCEENNITEVDLISYFKTIGFEYNSELNQFK